MDAFESIITSILRVKGWWVHGSVRVNLTKEEKRAAGRPSMPRYELDIVAYKAGKNRLLVIECKSYLDSPGVRAEAFENARSPDFKRYKLFNEPNLWQIVQEALCRQLLKTGACCGRPSVHLSLAAGRIAAESDRMRLRRLFGRKRWLLLDDRWVARQLRKLSDEGYANNEAMIAAKILERARQGAN